MNLHAIHPERKAPMKPTAKGMRPIPPSKAGSLIMSMTFKKDSPKIGIKTIRKENWAMLSFLLPRISPVAIVVPERDNPGKTATACPRPIINASR